MGWGLLSEFTLLLYSGTFPRESTSRLPASQVSPSSLTLHCAARFALDPNPACCLCNCSNVSAATLSARLSLQDQAWHFLPPQASLLPCRSKNSFSFLLPELRKHFSLSLRRNLKTIKGVHGEISACCSSGHPIAGSSPCVDNQALRVLWRESALSADRLDAPKCLLMSKWL